MMEALYKTRDGRLTIKVSGETQKALFKALAGAQDVFEAETTCGICESTAIRFSARTIDDNDFFELVCLNCEAKFSFGQHKKGDTLFPKRSGEFNGWAKWHAVKDEAPAIARGASRS